jgi:hypothetical protein
MWTTALKFVAILFLKNRMEFAKVNFFKKLSTNSGEDLNRLKENIAAMAESRAAIFKQNFNHEIRRVVKSVINGTNVAVRACLGQPKPRYYFRHNHADTDCFSHWRVFLYSPLVAKTADTASINATNRKRLASV